MILEPWLAQIEIKVEFTIRIEFR